MLVERAARHLSFLQQRVDADVGAVNITDPLSCLEQPLSRARSGSSGQPAGLAVPGSVRVADRCA
jgi:hypothetical protein